MGKDTGFLEFKKESPPLRPVGERVHDFEEYDTFLSTEKMQRQASRCMDCGIPFCHMGCPLGNMIPDWNELVYHGRWQEALITLHSTNNFPEFTGRVCPAPCEDSCVLNEHYTLDRTDKQNKVNVVTIEEIEKHIVERGWQEGWIIPQPPEKLTGKNIAVVGSGPSGLAAAQQLRRAGHAVTVFEKDDRIGGLLVYGIPDFKLDKKVVSRRVEQLRSEGVEFRTGVNVGEDYSVAELRSNYDAVLLAVGAQHARKFLPEVGKTEDNHLKGVHYAMDYLPQRNREVAGDIIPAEKKIEAAEKTAVILGGGFTGADCLGNLNRQGANPRIHQFELVDMEPRPTPVHEEANPDCRANIMTDKIICNESGEVTGLQAVRVQWKDKNGHFSMERIPGSEFTVSTDLVFLALGFLGPKVDGLLSELGVELDVRGKEKLSSPAEVRELLLPDEVLATKGQPVFAVYSDQNYMTSEQGVFVAGDANRGASLVVWAIWEGREAARCIDQYLMGSSQLMTLPQAETLA
ncbi:MAG: glutamate synthase subunit beta [SAR324 cluster bacterium]|nr:glutamate synthase subunit beta [SAR324 cluster bacterium]MBL7034150.1 glutamate synthase subunit beta [SAR324 cluster bacterium]